MMKTFVLLMCPLFYPSYAGAAETAASPATDNGQSVRFDAQRKVFLIRTAHSSYSFGLGDNGLFVNLHWGERVEDTRDIPEPWETHLFPIKHTFTSMRYSRFEYPANAAGYTLEPCLKIGEPHTLADLTLSFVSHAIEGDHLQVVLAAKDYPCQVVLHYRVYPDLDLIDRRVEIQNKGTEEMIVENIQSAIWYVPHTRKYRLTHIAGNWGEEWLVRREVVDQGEKVIESRNGISGHQHVPYFALDQDGLATENTGNVWFGTLQWSGNWKMVVEQDQNNQVHVSGGYNDYDFTLELAPGQSRTTPVFTAGFTTGGFGEASRLLHRYQRKYLYPENMRNVEVPIVFNTISLNRGSYKREYVTEKNVLALVPFAAQIGAELFIIDAGWQTAIGEWTANKEKFPRGLKPIIDEVHRRGMKFGVWIEPERVMFNAKLFSDPSKQDWLFAKNTGSAMINLSRRDVLEYVYQELATLLRENGISYLKLDFNRYFDVPAVSDRRTMRTKYVENFYELFARLRKDFPNVFFENCASGSGRPDLKMDTYFARINRSDIQSPLDSLVLHEGFTYLHPTYMAGGGSNMGRPGGKVPFQFSAHIGMMGWLATSHPLDTATPQELKEIRRYCDLFKRIRHVTCRGEIHRIASVREHPYAAFEYVLPDASEALLFVFGFGLRANERIPNIQLEALAPGRIYDVEVHGGSVLPKGCQYRSVSGQSLMKIGIPVGLSGDYDSQIVHFKVHR